MKRRSLHVSLVMAVLACMSPAGVASQAPQSAAASSDVAPGLSMKETEAWIHRELPKMGSDYVVTRYKGTNWGDKYAIQSAVLSQCVLTIRQVSQHIIFLPDGTAQTVPNLQTNTSRITMKDVDVSRGLLATEESVGADTTKSKPSYWITVVALSDRGNPFLSESEGYAGGRTEKSVSFVYFRVREQSLGNQAGEVFRRAAVLCGAPNQPVQTALAKTAPETQSSGTPANPSSPPEHTASALVGRYVTAGKNGSNYYVDFAADGTFHLLQDGKNYDGTYKVQADTVTVQGKYVPVYSMHLVGDTIVEPDGSVWAKENVQPKAQSPMTNPSAQGPSKMTNDDVIKLVTAGLSEKVVTTAIRQAPAKAFDLTPTGLIALKKANVSDAVILAMQDDTPVPAAVPPVAAAQKYDPTLAEPPKPAPAPVLQNGCSGIDNLGLYKNQIFDRAMGGGVVEWLAKIRNNTAVTKIVIFGWRDMYGQEKQAQVEIQGGAIVSPRLDLTQARVIPPVSNFRLLSCE